MECYATQILAWGKIFNCNPLSLFLLFFCSPALNKFASCCHERSEGQQKGKSLAWLLLGFGGNHKLIVLLSIFPPSNWDQTNTILEVFFCLSRSILLFGYSHLIATCVLLLINVSYFGYLICKKPSVPSSTSNDKTSNDKASKIDESSISTSFHSLKQFLPSSPFNTDQVKIFDGTACDQGPIL